MRNLGRLSLLGVGLMLAGCAIEGGANEPSTGGEGEGPAPAQGPATEVEPATADADTVPSSPRFDAELTQAAAEFGVPAAVLKGIAWTQTRYEMVAGEEEFDGKAPAFGVMALSGERLEKGAALAGVTVEDAKTSPLANIRAAAALLSSIAKEQGIARAEVASWEPVVAEISGIEGEDARREFVRDGVYGAMRFGLGAVAVDASYSKVFDNELTGPLEVKAAGPDYAGAVWRPSPNFNARPTKAAMVVIHTCESGYSGCWSWLTQSRSQVSAHYVVKEDGREISQLVREASRAWHVGATYNAGLNGGVDAGRNGQSVNNFAIGIEHGGYASQKTFPAGQLEASAKLVCNITKDNGIVRDRFHIVGHGKLQPYNRTDPGPNWPWTSYIARINQLCGSGGGAAPPPPPPGGGGGELVIDSNNARNDKTRGYIDVSGNWTSSTNVGGYYGTGYWWASTASVSDGATFYFHLGADAVKTVDAQWTAAGDRAPDAPFVAFNSRGERLGVVEVNQRVNGGRWNQLGAWKFTAGWNKIVLSRWTSGGNVVIADAVRVR